MKITKTDSNAGHLGRHNHHSTAFQQSLRTIAGPLTHTHSNTHKPLAQTVGKKHTTAQPPIPAWMKRGTKEIPQLTLAILHTQRRRERGLQSAGIWHEQTLTKPSGPRRSRKREGEGGGAGGGVAVMPFPSRQPVEWGAQGEEEQNEWKDGLPLLLLLLLHVEVSVLGREVSHCRQRPCSSSTAKSPAHVICSNAGRIQMGCSEVTPWDSLEHIL